VDEISADHSPDPGSLSRTNTPGLHDHSDEVYRLEEKKALRRVSKISNAHVFEPLLSRAAAERRLIDELLTFFGGGIQPVIAHLIEAGKLTMEDVKEAKGPCGIFRRKENPNELGMASRSGKSSMAIDDCCRCRRPACPDDAETWRSHSVLDLVRRVAQIPRAVFAPRRVGSSIRMAACSGSNGHHLVFMGSH
jgi:hypothetical protein